MFSLVSTIVLLLVVSALYVAFSPASRMATARQRWRERAAAMACQNMMESAAYKSYGGRVLDCKWRVLACLETRYDLYFDCCAAGDEKWSKSVLELALRLADVLPYRTQDLVVGIS